MFLIVFALLVFVCLYDSLILGNKGTYRAFTKPHRSVSGWASHCGATADVQLAIVEAVVKIRKHHLLFLPQSWKWKTGPLKMSLVSKMVIFHLMIMGERVTKSEGLIICQASGDLSFFRLTDRSW